jgi:hypothetical protein
MEKAPQSAPPTPLAPRVAVGRGRSPKAKTLIAFSILIMLLFCVFVAYQASKAYERSIEDGKTNATRLTRILSDQVDLTFLAVDVMLHRAVERQYFNTMFGGNLPHDIENNFRLWVDETPQIAAMMLVDDRGVIRVAANKKGYDQWYNYSESVEKDPAFTGKAAIEEARLDIDDLVVMSGNTGIRLRGAITDGTDSPGILLSGRMKDISASFLKQIWPPIVVPKTRRWVNENVREGRITEGEFVINLPVDALAAAQRKRVMPPGAVNLSFRMEGVKSGYFKDLPPLIGGSGEARLTISFRISTPVEKLVETSTGVRAATDWS